MHQTFAVGFVPVPPLMNRERRETGAAPVNNNLEGTPNLPTGHDTFTVAVGTARLESLVCTKL